MENLTVQNLFSVTEVDLIYRNKVKASERIKVNSSKKAYEVFISVWDMNKIELCEQFLIILLNRTNLCIGISKISTGGISTCLADPKIIFATALKARASGIILAHNHPSGCLEPSKPDIELTKRIKHGGTILDITVNDHLIVTPESYFSFADAGLVFY